MRYLLLLTMLAGTALGAEVEKADKVYRWVDEKGVVHYTDDPPAKGAKPAQLPPLQTFKARGRSGGSSAPNAPARAGPISVQIVSPAAEETIRGSSIQVTARATPSGVRRYVFYLDGLAQTEPIESPSFVLPLLERGSHSVAVAVVDGTGKELARSPAVTVHVKQLSQISPRRNSGR